MVFLGAHLNLSGIDVGFLASDALTSSVNEFPPAVTTFNTEVRSSVTDATVFCESCEQSDMVTFKNYD